MPGSRKRIATRRVSRRPFAALIVGDELRVARRTRARARRSRIASTARRRIEHITEVFTRAAHAQAACVAPSNVVQMPTGDGSVVAEFLRYHVLVRVFDGDPDAWLAQLCASAATTARDVRFVRWIRSRLRQDPVAARRDPQDGGRDAVLARRAEA